MINISIAFDDRFCLPARVMFSSILLNSNENDKIRVFILDGGLSASTKEKFNKLQKIKEFEVRYVNINNQDFTDYPLPKHGHFRPVNYYRIMIPELISEVDKVLYLDCDIIVQKQLKNLYDLDISNFLLGAAKSVTSYRNNRRLRIPKFIPYINSGVMLINSNRWRSENVKTKLINYITTAPQEKLLNVDQDAINAVLYDSIYYIDRRWNVEIRNDIAYPKYYQKFLNDPYIMHYVSPDKPWLETTRHDTSLFNYYKKVIDNL